MLYIVEGVLHRPSNEGPAIIDYDAEGNIVATRYLERGKTHRDPKEGPALQGFLAAYDPEQICYIVDDQFHRDESDGPARIFRHQTSGEVLVQEYFCHGRLHRVAVAPGDRAALDRIRYATGRDLRQAGLPARFTTCLWCRRPPGRNSPEPPSAMARPCPHQYDSDLRRRLWTGGGRIRKAVLAIDAPSRAKCAPEEA